MLLVFRHQDGSGQVKAVAEEFELQGEGVGQGLVEQRLTVAGIRAAACCGVLPRRGRVRSVLIVRGLVRWRCDRHGGRRAEPEQQESKKKGQGDKVIIEGQAETADKEGGQPGSAEQQATCQVTAKGVFLQAWA